MNTMTTNWVDLCATSDIAEGEALGVRHGESWISIYHLDGAFFATDNICPHAFALLSDGWLEDGLIECPLHGALFDVKTGEVKRGPADCSVRCHPVQVVDGKVQVGLP